MDDYGKKRAERLEALGLINLLISFTGSLYFLLAVISQTTLNLIWLFIAFGLFLEGIIVCVFLYNFASLSQNIIEIRKNIEGMSNTNPFKEKESRYQK